MSLGRNSAQFGDKPGCTNMIDDKRRNCPTIFVGLISCAVTAPVFVWFAKTVFFNESVSIPLEPIKTAWNLCVILQHRGFFEICRFKERTIFKE